MSDTPVTNEEKLLGSTNTPEDVAAGLFRLYHPRYMALIDSLSMNALRRVAKAIIVYPLEEGKWKHTTPQEKEAVLLGDKLCQAKIVMFMKAMEEQAQKEIEAQEQNKTEVVVDKEEKQ